MPADAPDFVLLIQIGITLDQDVVPPSAVTHKAIIALDRWTGSDATYNTVVSYTVPVGKSFELEGLEIAASDYTLAQFRVTIAGVEQFADKYRQTSFSPRVGGPPLKAGDVVLIEAHSDGATSIDVDGAIEGKEIG